MSELNPSRKSPLRAALMAAALVAGCGGGGSSGGGNVLPPPPPPGAINWGAAVTLATNAGGITAPAAAIDGAGLAAVLWAQTGIVPAAGQAPLTSPHVVARENTAAGWAATQLIEAPVAGDAAIDQVISLQALAPTTGLSAAWLRLTGAGERVGSARHVGGAWERGDATAAANAARTDLAFASNNAGVRVVVWSQTIGGVSQIVGRRWVNSVVGWTDLPQVQSSSGIAGTQPAVAIDDDGRVMIVWRQGTASLGPPALPRVHTGCQRVRHRAGSRCRTDRHAGAAVIAYGPNKFLAVWEQLFNNTYDLRSKAGNASNWDQFSDTLDTRAEAVGNARLMAGPNNTALVAWQQADRVFASRWAEATGNWSQPLGVGANLTGVARDLRAGINAAGNAILVWTQRGTSGIPDLYYATVAGTVPIATEPALLETEAGAAGSPALGVNGNGQAVVAWLQSISGQTQPNLVARVAR
jgi:hypothetical protein